MAFTNLENNYLKKFVTIDIRLLNPGTDIDMDIDMDMGMVTDTARMNGEHSNLDSIKKWTSLLHFLAKDKTLNNLFKSILM